MDPKWTVLLIACARAFFTTGSVKVSGVFLDEMTHRLNTTNSLVAWALSLQNATSLIIAPFSLFLLEMFSFRTVFVVGSFLAGGSYVLCGLLTETVSQLFLWFCLSGLGFGLCILPTFLSLKAHHKQEFPIMICTVHLFHFIGVAVLPPLFQFYRSNYDLTGSLIIYGAVLWNLLPLGCSFPSLPSETALTPEGTHLFNQKDREQVKGSIGKTVDTTDKSHEYEKRKTFCLQRWLTPYLGIFVHRTFIVIAVAELTQKGIIFTSWALIVVSFGKSVGLPPEYAVFLSTIGGIGGFFGKIIAVLLCKFDRMNMTTSYVIPCIINGISFIAFVYLENFYIISALMFMIGLGIALNLSGLMSLLPFVVCKNHFNVAAVVIHISSGVGVQFGGLYAGFIYDITGLAVYVLAMNGVLSFFMLLPAFIWGFTNRTVEDCRYDDDS